MEENKGGREGKEKKRVVVESLGWLTESSIMPKKHRTISGVGPSSILELKAQLYKSQEESKRNASSKEVISGSEHLEVHRAKKIVSPNDPFSNKNSGVEARALKDKLELRAANDGSASYAALEKKAALYEKLVRGELSDEEDKEKYCVDFFQKSLIHESEAPRNRDTLLTEPPETEDDENDAALLFNAKPVGLGRTSGIIDNNEHKRFVREVHEEVNQAREKASELKLRQQEQVAARREKLKQAYLRKQVEKLKAVSKTEQT